MNKPVSPAVEKRGSCGIPFRRLDWQSFKFALIVETLEQAGWIVGGPRGAAAKLRLKRTTLLAKMRRMGISRPIHQEGTDGLGIAPETIRREDAQL